MDIMVIFQSIQRVGDYRIIILPFILMVIDLLTGISEAWATGHIKSYRMREGLNRKFGEISIIIIGLVFHWLINIPFYLVGALIFYIILMELISICENLDKMNLPIPKWIKKSLKNAELKIQEEPFVDKDEDNGKQIK